MVLVYTLYNKIHGLLAIKSRFLTILWAFLAFLKKLSRNRRVLCGYVTEQPQLGGGGGGVFFSFCPIPHPLGRKQEMAHFRGFQN